MTTTAIRKAVANLAAAESGLGRDRTMAQPPERAGVHATAASAIQAQGAQHANTQPPVLAPDQATMMLRWLGIALSLRWRDRLDVLGTSRLRMRVWLSDLDANLHMNNARFFGVADLGRLDQGLRSGLWRQAFRQGWRPLAGDSNARFSSSLAPFASYELHTRLLGWDDKWFFSEHRFLVGTRVVAVVVVRYLFAGRQGRVSTAQALALAGHQQPSPPLPDWVLQWSSAQSALSRQLKNESFAA